ncbi:MAG: hypothetical protein IPJ65_32665 [Archangiaceae bacterium]|nr:hypothetical protein [Archangiaceae bacterium]
MIAEKRPARALASLNLVLAHDPTNQKTLELLARLKAHSARQKRMASSLRFAVAAGALFIVGSSVWKGVEVAQRVDEYQEPLVRRGSDVPVLTAGLFPAPPEKKVEAPPPDPVLPVQPPPEVKAPVKVTARSRW